MSSWRARVLMVLAGLAMVLVVSIPAMADIDEEYLEIDDNGDLIISEHDNGGNGCIGVEDGDGCLGIDVGTGNNDCDFEDYNFDGSDDDDFDFDGIDDDCEEQVEVFDLDGVTCYVLQDDDGDGIDEAVCVDDETGEVVFED